MTFPPLKNDRLLRVINEQLVDKTPVWIMRQAGRYLPEFREMRSRHGFFDICRSPELACEITLQPIRRFHGLFDASIIFCDILVIPQALGMVVEMKPSVGPHFPAPLVDPADAQSRLPPLTESPLPYSLVDKELGYVYDAIKLTRQSLDGQVPLYGFAGAPWTIFAYMAEGGGSKTFSKAKRWLWTYPEESKRVLDIVARTTTAYLVRQVEQGGAQILQVFDSWAGELSSAAFREFALPYLRYIATTVKQELRSRDHPVVPMVVFAKGAHYAIEELVGETEYDVFGLDWTMDAFVVKRRLRAYFAQHPQKRRHITLQGNLDPTILYGPAEKIRAETEKMLRRFLLTEDGQRLDAEFGYICNLGHGIQPEVPVESVQVFLSAVRDVSIKIFQEHKK